MDNQQVLDLFINRGMIDRSLAQDMLHEIDNSGKEIGEILADYQVIGHRNDIWPVIAQELSAEMVDISEWSPPEEILALVPAGMARLHGALPVNFTN
jgi:type IV pilus assembly protein PilB